MKRISNIKLGAITISAIILSVCIGCTKDEFDSENPSNSTKNVYLSTDWGATPEDVIESMKGYVLDEENENYLYFSKRKSSQIIAYEFYEGKLRTSLLMIPEDKTTDDAMLKLVSGYTEVGTLDDKRIFSNEGKNTLVSYCLETDGDITYAALGLTQLEQQLNSDNNSTYSVGDYYNDGNKEGVVFWVDKMGKHGKIVSLNGGVMQWCAEGQYNNQTLVGATSETDGKANTDKVMARNDYEQYSAFVWCRSKGKDWYLPAINELELLLLNDSVHDAVNQTLESLDATKLGNKKGDYFYWSSTEDDKTKAWGVDLYYVSTSDLNKHVPYYVRAVSAF